MDVPSAKVALRVLVVDDHRDTSDTLARMLRKAGYRVWTAITYSEAIGLCDGDGYAAAEVSPAVHGIGSEDGNGDGQRFDLLIADTDLPNGDGLQLLQLLRDQLGGRIRGIVLSGYHGQETIDRAKQMGFDEYLIKPASLQEIVDALQRCTAVAKRSNGG